MSNAGWGPQNQPVPNQPGQAGGYPPQAPPPGYPPQPGQPPAFPPQGQPGYPPGYPPQQTGSYPPQGPPPGYQPQGAYNPQARYGQRPGQPSGGYPPQGPPAKKSPLMLVLIVVAAVVLLATVGGIIMALNRGGGDQPETTITPSQPTAPPSDPTPSPTDEPTASSPQPTDEPNPPSGDSVDLGNGISLTPASGWSVKKTGKGVAQLSNGSEIFLGQAISTEPSTNPGQLCTAWHKQVTEGTSGGKFQDPKNVDLGTSKVKGATCLAQTTVSSGQGTATIFLFSLASVRQSDGVTVLGTAYFTGSANTEQLNKDFTTMVNSMLDSQTS